MNSPSSGLVVIARDATGRIVTRISSSRDLLGAMNTAQSVLRLKGDAVRAEVHLREATASEYLGKPLAAFNADDLARELIR